MRAAIDARAASAGWPALHAELAAIDPATAQRLAPNDAQRIQRALEVHALSGRPLSRLAHPKAARREPPPLISLEPDDRAWLHARIAERFQAMLEAGLVDEVRALRARGDLQPELPSMRAVGYRQAWAALDAGDLRELARHRHRRHPAAGQAPAHLAARHAEAAGRSLRRGRCHRARGRARRGAGASLKDRAMAVLEIGSLAKHYGESTVFANVNLTVRAGEFVAVLGESGVGKSTLLNCIAGLDRIDAGSVRIDASTCLHCPSRRRRPFAATISASCSRPSTCCRI